MQLHGTPLSPNVFRPLLVARHLGLEVELVPVDFGKGEHKGEAFRKLNPHGRIPVLVDGDYALWESVAICQYLAAQRPSELWPEDTRARATITSWQAWATNHFKLGVQPILFERLVKPMMGMGDADEGVVANALKVFAAEAAVLEDRLNDGGGWLVGGGLTLADLDVAGYLLHAAPIRLPVADYPAVAAWHAKVSALPAWAAAKG